MSLGTGDPASETGDDSLSAITFDSDFETKTKKKSFHKPPPTSPKSPYHSKLRKVASCRSLRTAASMPLGNRMSFTPQKLRLGSSRQGNLTQPLKPGLTMEHGWTQPPGSTPDYLTEALRVKRSNLRRSASNGHVPGTPVYREKEDMYDEIIGLKKALHLQKNDADLLRTRLRRLEEETSRKDRQIEQLLEPSRDPDFVWTPAEKRPDPSWSTRDCPALRSRGLDLEKRVVNGLRQRILKLEQQCRDKDSTISKLQTDIKTTNLEEMRIAMEMCYEEIYRLQTLLANSETAGRKPLVEKKAGLKRQKKLGSTLLSLSRSVQELTEENQSLKADLDRVLSSSPTVSQRKEYMEWSKPRLLRRITELEKKIHLLESPKPRASEAVRSDPLALSTSGSPVPKQPRAECHEDREHQEDSEHLRGAVRSLRDERRALQAQLQERDSEVKQLLQMKADLEQELEKVRAGEKERSELEEALREEIQVLTKKFRDLEAVRKEEEEDPPEMTPEEDSEPDASLEGLSRPPCTCSEGQRHAAARILQARWKVHRRQKRKAVLDEAATVLQAAFRGHLARAKLLLSTACGSASPTTPSFRSQSSPSPGTPSPVGQAAGDPEEVAAITVIQSVLRAHLARVRHSQRTSIAAAGTSASATHSAPSPPAFPAASIGQEDSDVSSGDAEDGPALEARALKPWGPGTQAAPPPCPVESPSSGLRASAPPHVEDVYSDSDSDEIVMAPSLPVKKNAHLPPVLGLHRGFSHGDSLSGEG